jgi:hypothetical protein
MLRLLAIGVVMFAACGGDEPPKPPAAGQTAATPTGAAAPGAGLGSGRPLPVMRRIEQQVSCDPPRKGSKKCDPNAPRPVRIAGQEPDPATDLSCPDAQYCLPTSEGFLCGPCSERETIRHAFKDRDFAPETNRDPFQSFLIRNPAGAGSGELPRDPTSRCKPNEPIRSPNYGFQDLKLVGIVAQGTQRKVLMMDPGGFGHIIKRLDCVGKEKAFVKEIGENFICFELADAQAQAGNTRLQDALCFELHTKQMPITAQPTDAPFTPGTGGPTGRPGTSITPVTPPPPTLPPRAGSGSAAGSGSGSAPVVAPPGAGSQAPTTLKP